jgi:hypothetical protein
MNSEIWRRPATLVALLVVGVAIVALLFFVFAGGSPPASPLPSASPTAAAQVSPSVDASLLPGATIGPGTSPSPQPTGSPALTTSPEPSPSAPITPVPITPGPTSSTPSLSPSPAPPSGWIELDDFPTYGRATEVSSITAGGPGFVAVGSSGRSTPQGRVWTSQDGRSWSAQPDATFAGHRLDIVVRAGQTLYAFGDSRIWSSPDGATWSLLPPPELGGAIMDVAVSGDTMIAVFEVVDEEENFSAAVWRSNDGTAWQRVGAPPLDTGLYTVAASGNLLVASQGYPQFSPPLLWYSTDLGDNWQPAQTDLVMGEDGNVGIVDVAADGGRFVAVGYEEREDYEPLVLVSTDGASWQSASLPPAAAGQIFDQVSARPGGYLALTHRSGGDGRSWTSADGAGWSAGPTIYERNLVFQPGDTPGDDVVTHRALAVGPAGAVVAEFWRFAEPGQGGLHVWFAPPAAFE